MSLDTNETRAMNHSSRLLDGTNTHLNELSADILFHLDLSTSTDDLAAIFGDVKFVCVGGTIERMRAFSQYMKKQLNSQSNENGMSDFINNHSRYALFKSGPLLCVSHGIGCPSISIVLNEVMKLLHYAGAEDVIFIRMGTCGAVGCNPGSLIISSEVVDGLLRPYQELKILGRLVRRPSRLDKYLAEDLKATADIYFPETETIIGKTMCTDDFYEGQGRLDGAFCEYSQMEKLLYFQKLKQNGICNIEMESLTFASMCANAGVKGAVVCVALLDRLKGDQVTSPKEVLQGWEQKLLTFVAIFIKQKLERTREMTKEKTNELYRVK